MAEWSHPVCYSFRDYLAHEEASNTRNECLDGNIYAVAGGTPEHSALSSSVNAHLAQQLRGGRCRVHMADLRIRVRATGLATYPDLSVVCGPWERDPGDGKTIVNPIVIVEVLSPSTEEYDRGEKLEHFQKIPTLREYVLVAQDRRAIEVWSRGDGDRWRSVVAGAGEAAVIASIAARLDVDAVYGDASEPA